MAKFSSEFSGQAAGAGYSIQSGVQGATANPWAGVTNLASGVGNLVKNNAATAAAEAKLQEEKDVGNALIPLLDFEREEMVLAGELANLENEALSATDNASTQAIMSKYTSMTKAEASGANPASIKARKNAYLRQVIADKPHLAKDILAQVGKIDGLASFSDTGSNLDNPIAQAQAQMLKTAATGISIPMQMQLAQVQYEADSAKAQVELQTANGTLKFPELYNAAKLDSRVLAQEVNQMVGSIVDPTTPEFQGIDGASAKMLLTQNLDTMVTQRMSQYIGQAQQAGITLTGSQLDSMEKQMRGSIQATMDPYLDAMDSADWMERTGKILKTKVEIANNLSVLEFQKAEPNMHKLQQIYGKEQAFTISTNVARIQTILKDEIRQANLPTLMQNDPDLAFAYQVMEDQGLFGMVEQKLANPGTVVAGNEKLDTMATAGALEALKGGSLNMQGEMAVLGSVMYGNSYNNTTALLDDKYYNRLRTDVDSQKALRNFTVNEVDNVFGPIRDAIVQDDLIIKFTPVSPNRVKKSQQFFDPAPAFVATTRDGRDVSMEMQKHVRKLNTLYTLHGSFAEESELRTLGERLSGFVDQDDPKFIAAHSAEMITQLEGKVKYHSDKRDRLLGMKRENRGTGSIYDSPEERTRDLDARLMQSDAEISGLELQMEAQRMRNRDYADPLSALPPGTVMDKEASKNAGKPIYKLPDGQLVEMGV